MVSDRSAVTAAAPWPQRVCTALLCLLLAWVCLPFGSVTPGASTIALTALFLAFSLASAAGPPTFAETRGAPLPDVAPAPPWTQPYSAYFPALMLALVAVLGVLQSLSWPIGWVQFLSPESAALQRQARSLLEPATEQSWATFSLVPEATRQAALGWAAIAAGYLAALRSGAYRNHRRFLVAALGLSAGFQLVYGLPAWAAQADEIWGVQVRGGTSRLRGTFINPNHLALYLELALVCAFAFGWWGLRRARLGRSLERWMFLLGPPILVWLILFVAIAFTGSRAGLLAAIAGAAFQGLVLAISQRRWLLAPLGLAVAGAGIAAVASLGVQEGLGRWLGTSYHELAWNARSSAYEAGLRLWERFALLGTGLGTFQDVFPLVQPSSLRGLWQHAHNDLLELLVTGGVVGAALIVAGVLCAGARWLAVVRDGRRTEDRAAGLAALGALATVTVHSAFDFGLTIWANALTLAVLCGAAAGARTHRVEPEDEPEPA